LNNSAGSSFIIWFLPVILKYYLWFIQIHSLLHEFLYIG